MDAHFVDDEYRREGCIAINDVKVRELCHGIAEAEDACSLVVVVKQISVKAT